MIGTNGESQELSNLIHVGRRKWHKDILNARLSYISRRIAGMVYKDPYVSIAAIIESIKTFSNYTVNYGKAWRAKQHAISMLWGDWKDC
jgi:hypothetical protein